MAALRKAESRGLDVDRALPALVQGRSLSSANDIAAVIHGRVSKRAPLTDVWVVDRV